MKYDNIELVDCSKIGGQTRVQSAVESFFNTASGVLISWGAGFVIYPMFGHSFRPTELISITLIFTVISVLRSYFWRRLFNRRHA